MTYFFISDIHIDYWIDNGNRNGLTRNAVFHDFYRCKMSPADVLVIAGDVANDYDSYVSFIKFIHKKYKKTYICFGNHDGCVDDSYNIIKSGTNLFYDTFEKFDAIRKCFSKFSGIVFLDGRSTICNGIGGCMGMCDFSLKQKTFDVGKAYKISKWHNCCDSKLWRMHSYTDFSRRLCGINPIRLWDKYKNDMLNIAKQHPKIMVTHYAPKQLGTMREFENGYATSYFYFDAKDMLDELDDGSYWVCGHIHTRLKRDYVNINGNTIHLMSVPSAYPWEDPSEYGLTLENGIKLL